MSDKNHMQKTYIIEMLEKELVNPSTKVEFQNRFEKGASYAPGLAHILKCMAA
jgi:hypothetical protein